MVEAKSTNKYLVGSHWSRGRPPQALSAPDTICLSVDQGFPRLNCAMSFPLGLIALQVHANIVAIEVQKQFVSANGSRRPISALNFAKSFLPLQYWKA